PLPVGAGRAVAGERAVDEARVDLAQARPVDAETLGHAHGEVFDHHVRLLDETQEESAPLRRLQVESDRLLRTAPLEEGDAEVGLVPLLERRSARAEIERRAREAVAR